MPRKLATVGIWEAKNIDLTMNIRLLVQLWLFGRERNAVMPADVTEDLKKHGGIKVEQHGKHFLLSQIDLDADTSAPAIDDRRFMLGSGSLSPVAGIRRQFPWVDYDERAAHEEQTERNETEINGNGGSKKKKRRRRKRR
jgi:hypothetical protein